MLGLSVQHEDCANITDYSKNVAHANLQGGCVFEQDDTVASLSAVFKSGKAAFAKSSGLIAFINQFKQVWSCSVVLL